MLPVIKAYDNPPEARCGGRHSDVCYGTRVIGNLISRPMWAWGRPALFACFHAMAYTAEDEHNPCYFNLKPCPTSLDEKSLGLLVTARANSVPDVTVVLPSATCLYNRLNKVWTRA